MLLEIKKMGKDLFSPSGTVEKQDHILTVEPVHVEGGEIVHHYRCSCGFSAVTGTADDLALVRDVLHSRMINAFYDFAENSFRDMGDAEEATFGSEEEPAEEEEYQSRFDM